MLKILEIIDKIWFKISIYHKQNILAEQLHSDMRTLN